MRPSLRGEACPSQRPQTSVSNHLDDRQVGDRVCLVGDSSQRGVLDSQGYKGFWAVRFADNSRRIHVADLKLLPSDAASFEPSQAPLSKEERQREKRMSADEFSNRGLSVAAST